MRARRRARRECFDVVFYAPWAAPLLGGSSFGGATGGGETQAVLLATAFARRGLRVAIVVMAGPDELPASVEGIRIIRQERRWSGGRLGRAELAIGALRAMASVETDFLIQMNAGPTTGVAALVARIRGARFIYMSVHVVDFEFGSLEPRNLNVKLFEWGVRKASEVVVQDAGQARLCEERFGHEPVVINSIATRAEPRTERPEAFLWVGRLQQWKRPDAYLELARAVPEAEFWMIVVPQESEPLETRRRVSAAARELPNLRLLEPRPREALGDLLNRAAAIVSTSDGEGMPNVFLEAWSRGVPALALSFDPDGMIARHGLGLWANGALPTLAEHARSLWHDRDDQAELAQRCLAYVRGEHGEEQVVERWIATFRRLSER
jgi:glycosyltransferase involved in cell wall biosynthesis